MMGPKQAVTACFQDYAKFRGRARRPEFWWWVLFVALSEVCLGLFDDAFWPSPPLVGLSGLFFIFTYVPGLAVQYRRFRDVGLPGWMSFSADVLALLVLVGHLLGVKGPMMSVVELIFLLSFVFVLLVCVLPSLAGKNRYGEEPLRG